MPSQKTIEVEKGTRLFDAAREAGLPVASSCGGEFVCGKCVMQVVSGNNNLSPQMVDEKELLIREGNAVTSRISCRATVLGDCTVTTRYW